MEEIFSCLTKAKLVLCMVKHSTEKLNAYQISHKTGINYSTLRTHLMSLTYLGVVKREKRSQKRATKDAYQYSISLPKDVRRKILDLDEYFKNGEKQDLVR